MSIKYRTILFIIFLLLGTPAIYFAGINLIYEVMPLDIELHEHIDLYHSLLDGTADKKMQLVCILAFAFPFFAFAPAKSPKGEHGSASFATSFLIKKMGLFKKEGVVLGKYGSKILRYDDYLSLLISAAPGEGKTTAYTIPNLLTYLGSMLVFDIKFELWNKTSAHRRDVLKQKVYQFNPASLHSVRYNPMDKTIIDRIKATVPDEVKEEAKKYNRELLENEIEDTIQIRIEEIVNELSFLIYPKTEGSSAHWVDNGRSIFTMYAIYTIYLNGGTSISEIMELLLSDFGEFFGEEDDFESPREAFIMFIETEIAKNEEIPLVAREEANKILNTPENEFGSIISACGTPLRAFKSKAVRECFRTNDFHIEDFRKEASTIYISISEKNVSTYEVPLRIFIEMNLTKLLSQEATKKDKTLHVLADEFLRFGKLNYLMSVPALGRSYKVFVSFIIQDYAQAIKLYGKEDIDILNGTTAYKLIFPQANGTSAKLISDSIGDFTRETVSQNKSSTDKGQISTSSSTNLSAQALLSKQDLLNMNDGELYILRKNYMKHPIKAKPYYFFKDRKLKKLVPKEEDI
ncbi:MAG: hypothetical protein DRG78_00780 [Epsilonproteobacteria bacterium]|nr:MAG: hypothetical protein DRG78_00780 [Campylobacterota bacterium]